MTKIIASVEFGDQDFPGFLDMLRYDGAVVESWAHWEVPHGNRWRVTLSAPRLTPDRWSSFNLYLKEQDGTPLR